MAGADAVIATRVNRAMEVVTQDRITRNVPILVRLRQQRGNSSAEVRQADRDSKFRLYSPFLDRTQEQLSCSRRPGCFVHVHNVPNIALSQRAFTEKNHPDQALFSDTAD